MKLAVLILFLTVLVMPALAVDVDKWIQDLRDSSPIVRDTGAGESLTQMLIDRQVRGEHLPGMG